MGKARYLIVLVLITALALVIGCAKKPPTIERVSPNQGPEKGGTTITITGLNFREDATVTIGGKAATSVTVASKTEITAVTPSGAVGSADIVVTNVKHELSATLTGGFTYLDTTKPQVTSTTPADGDAIDPKDAVDTDVNRLVVTYSEPIASNGSMTISMESLEDALAKHEADIEGSVSFEGNSIVFTPGEDLVSARKYTVSVSGVQDVAGNAASDHTFSFSITTPERVHFYTVRKGDNLKTIAARPDVYDDMSKWPWLVEGNQDDYNFDRDRIIAGQRLLVPWWDK
jgi:hypothetical protein